MHYHKIKIIQYSVCFDLCFTRDASNAIDTFIPVIFMHLHAWCSTWDVVGVSNRGLFSHFT